jgi:ubiquinone/menaquinone biosynthesis C-methylase UbiE
LPHRRCPWWLGYLLACPLRKFGHHPERILAPHVTEGMTVLEPGPGMGYFTLELARRVGPRGRVVAVDIEPKMLRGLARRASKAGLAGRIETRLAGTDGLGIQDLAGAVDFTLAFAVVHEMPDAAKFFHEAAEASKTGAALLLAEPAGHVKPPEFDAQLAAASAAGFTVEERPTIRRSQTALLRKK